MLFCDSLCILSKEFYTVETQKNKKLLDVVREKLRIKHYSIKTEKTYLYWIKQYILFHNKKHPKNMGKNEIEQFLTYLAIDKKVSSSAQNQAFNAILFLYEKALNISLKEQNISAMRAKRKEHVPVVLTINEVQQIIYYMNGIYKLMLQLLYRPSQMHITLSRQSIICVIILT